MRALASLVLAALLAAIPQVAQACRVFIPPEQRISGAYANQTISGVALVEVESAEYVGDAIQDSHPWVAKARVVQPLWGSGHFPNEVEFLRGGGSSMCEWNLPELPKAGERWVVYFWMDRRSLLQPWLAVTPKDARAFDPRLRDMAI